MAVDAAHALGDAGQFQESRQGRLVFSAAFSTHDAQPVRQAQAVAGQG
jgi:hypothetical protein